MNFNWINNIRGYIEDFLTIVVDAGLLIGLVTFDVGVQLLYNEVS